LPFIAPDNNTKQIIDVSELLTTVRLPTKPCRCYQRTILFFSGMKWLCTWPAMYEYIAVLLSRTRRRPRLFGQGQGQRHEYFSRPRRRLFSEGQAKNI